MNNHSTLPATSKAGSPSSTMNGLEGLNSGTIPITSTGAVIRWEIVNGVYYAKLTRARAKRHEWYYRFKNEADMQRQIARSIEAHDAHAKAKAERFSARAAFEHSYKAGEVLYAMWGYEQTNIDFYEVVAHTAKTVTLRAIAANRQYTGDMNGVCTAVAGRFTGEPKSYRVSQGDRVSLTSYSSAIRWDGKPLPFSTWA